jgi:hypothetical protein
VLWLDNAMTTHAALDRRHSSKRRSPCAAVAEPAIEAVGNDVVAMMEVDWLNGSIR